MSLRNDTWHAHWEVHGTRIDDDMSVPVRVGVIDVEGDLAAAISVASAAPVAITRQTAAGIGELMQWAQEELEMLYERQQQRRAASAKDAFDMALLTRRQWRTILHAIVEADTDHLTQATATLRAAAPRAWADETATEPQLDVADGDTAMVRLDDTATQVSDTATQVSDTATQVSELRRRFPTQPHDIDTGTAEDRRHPSGHAEEK